MGALKIKLAERHMMEHLRLGGTLGATDNMGRKLVQAFTRKVFQESNIKQICDNYDFTPAEIEAVIYAMIEELMPNPVIDIGGPLLVTTLIFMEPDRLEELLFGINNSLI